MSQFLFSISELPVSLLLNFGVIFMIVIFYLFCFVGSVCVCMVLKQGLTI